jgi:GT2 family glycosyltransferase
MKVFAIVVTFNGLKWIDKCLNSLLNSSIWVDVIVIDNQSADDTVSCINENFPQVHLVKTDKNLGFGKANNIGIKYALDNGADYIFLLNQDAWVNTDVLQNLIEIHQQNNEYGILSTVQLNGKGNALDYNFSLVCSVPNCPGLLSDVYLKTEKKIYAINFVMAAMWLIPSSVVFRVGLFDPIFPHYGEDLDYIQRAASFGYKAGICPGNNGFHDREERAPSHERELQIRLLTYLCILKNNNKKFLFAFGQFLSLWVRSLIGALINFYWAIFFKDFYGGLKLTFSIPKILRNRKYTKKEAAFLI